MMNTGNRIRAVRKGLGLTQQELADRLSVHKITLSNYERGAQNVPLDVILRVSELSGRPVAWFFLDAGQDIVGVGDQGEDVGISPEKALSVLKKFVDDTTVQHDSAWTDEMVLEIVERARKTGEPVGKGELELFKSLKRGDKWSPPVSREIHQASMNRKKKGGKLDEFG